MMRWDGTATGRVLSGAAIGRCSQDGVVRMVATVEWPEDMRDEFGLRLRTGQCPKCGSTIRVAVRDEP
jgi:hypothetical protein